MNKPLVSVVLTNYNGERFVEQAVRSVMAQTYENWELILVDDASTDRSPEILRNLEGGKIRLIENEKNSQVSFSHNRGNAAAVGQYIAALDNDDLWAPDKLEKQVAYMEAHPETGVCFTLLDLIDENGRKIRDAALEKLFDVDNMPREEWLHTLLLTGNHLANDSSLIRREVMEWLGENDLTMIQLHDFDMWARIPLKYEMHILREPLMSYRKVTNSGSISTQSRNNMRRVYFEQSWIVGEVIENMEDDLFRRVFRKEMKNPDATDSTEILMEKGLLMDSDLFTDRAMKSHAYRMFRKALRDPRGLNILREKYGLELKDIYRLTGSAVYDDPVTESLWQDQLSAAQGRATLAEQQVRDLTRERDQAWTDIAALRASFSWRVTAPVRKVTGGMKKVLGKNETAYQTARAMKTALTAGPTEAGRELRAYRKDKAIRERLAAGYLQTKEEENKQRNTRFPREIRFSVLVPLYNTPEGFLKDMIDSVRKQTYDNWELCLADGSDAEHGYVGEICQAMAATEPRILYRKLEKNLGISGNTNACIEMATGDYIALFDHDDILHPAALYEDMKVICEQGADFIYTDENTFHDTPADAFNPHFKPDFAPDTLRANNYICHFTVFDRKLLEKAGGGFRSEYDGSQDFDMVLRLTEQAEKIVHIPKILYYWRAHKGSVAESVGAKPYVIEAAKKAIAEHLKRVGLKGEALDSMVPSMYRLKYEIDGNPLISILIPNKDHREDLKRCIDSIRGKSTWTNWEIIIIENNSAESETFVYYRELEEDPRIRVVEWSGNFNYSAINNFGFSYAKGDHILLLNNDVEIISPDWLQEMLMYSQRSDVGAVGAKLYYPDHTIQHAGLGIGLLTLAGHYHRHFDGNHPGYMGRLIYAQDLSGVTAACMMLSRRVYEQMNGLDESFEVAFNDVDLCMRIRQAGYLIVFTPFAELTHYESKSRGQDDDPVKRARFVGEVERFQKRWKKEIEAGDPYYNPNFSLDKEDFSIRG